MLRLFFDMDGVLCDFDKKVKELNLPIVRNVPSFELTSEEKKLRNIFWNNIAEYKEKFWEELDLINQVIEVIYFWEKYPNISFNVLSKVPSNKACHDYAIQGKKNWLKNHNLSHVFENVYIVDKDKTKYCKNINDILIDDRESNCIEWQKAGGTAILFKDARQLNNAISSIFSWIKDDEIS